MKCVLIKISGRAGKAPVTMDAETGGMGAGKFQRVG
jgi:hypothetical protein